MKQTGSKKFRNTKKINQLRIKRKNYIINYLHKASGKLIEYKAKLEGIELITVNESYTNGLKNKIERIEQELYSKYNLK